MAIRRVAVCCACVHTAMWGCAEEMDTLMVYHVEVVMGRQRLGAQQAVLLIIVVLRLAAVLAIVTRDV